MTFRCNQRGKKKGEKEREKEGVKIPNLQFANSFLSLTRKSDKP